MENLEGEIGNIKTRLDNLYRQLNEIINRLYTATQGDPVLETLRSILVETRPLRIEMDSIKNTIPRLREMEQSRASTIEDREYTGWAEYPVTYNGEMLVSIRNRSNRIDTVLLSLSSLINYILDTYANAARIQNTLTDIRRRIAQFNQQTIELRRYNASEIQQEESYLRRITEIRQTLTRQSRNPVPEAAAARSFSQVTEADMRSSAASAAEIQDESAQIDTIPAADIPKMITCPVCLGKIKDVRLNCGHLVCRECARGLKQSNGICPVCRQPITKTEIVYYNKYLKYKNKYLQLKNKVF
jgi:hypothetical protein